MKQLPDDPIISCMMRTGEPPWMQDDDEPADSFAVYDPEQAK